MRQQIGECLSILIIENEHGDFSIEDLKYQTLKYGKKRFFPRSVSTKIVGGDPWGHFLTNKINWGDSPHFPNVTSGYRRTY